MTHQEYQELILARKSDSVKNFMHYRTLFSEAILHRNTGYLTGSLILDLIAWEILKRCELKPERYRVQTCLHEVPGAGIGYAELEETQGPHIDFVEPEDAPCHLFYCHRIEALKLEAEPENNYYCEQGLYYYLYKARSNTPNWIELCVTRPDWPTNWITDQGLLASDIDALASRLLREIEYMEPF